MQTAPQVIPPETNNPDADRRSRDFAHQLAKTHEVETVPALKNHLLDNLKRWELALRNANAIFNSVPAKDIPVF